MTEEMTLFDFPKLEINNKIRLIELFGGIGSQAMALRDLGADFETYKLVEFDKYAVQSYNAIHGTNFDTTDIRNVRGVDLEIRERERYTYLLTYSFPCTDLSVAGKMKGMSKEEWESGESTRSGLLWEVERIFKELPDNELPQVLLMENVPQVHSDQNERDFNAWLDYLKSRGYFSFWEDLNAKDYGIPQNRDRCFCVSILAEEYTDFIFPKPIKLEKVMRDFLEDEVDEKYYLKSPKAKELIDKLLADGTLPQEGGGVSQQEHNQGNGNGNSNDPLCERLQGLWNGVGLYERGTSKKKDQLNYVGNIRGGSSTTGICRECIPDGRTSPECSSERLQRPDSYNKSVIVGIIDPEGYDKENRVYSGGGAVSYPVSRKRASKGGY